MIGHEAQVGSGAAAGGPLGRLNRQLGKYLRGRHGRGGRGRPTGRRTAARRRWATSCWIEWGLSRLNDGDLPAARRRELRRLAEGRGRGGGRARDEYAALDAFLRRARAGGRAARRGGAGRATSWPRPSPSGPRRGLRAHRALRPAGRRGRRPEPPAALAPRPAAGSRWPPRRRWRPGLGWAWRSATRWQPSATPAPDGGRRGLGRPAAARWWCGSPTAHLPGGPVRVEVGTPDAAATAANVGLPHQPGTLTIE